MRRRSFIGAISGAAIGSAVVAKADPAVERKVRVDQILADAEKNGAVSSLSEYRRERARRRAAVARCARDLARAAQAAGLDEDDTQDAITLARTLIEYPTL